MECFLYFYYLKIVVRCSGVSHRLFLVTEIYVNILGLKEFRSKIFSISFKEDVNFYRSELSDETSFSNKLSSKEFFGIL